MLKPKQRAYLRSLANTLDPAFQIGKGGVSPELVAAVDQALESRELLKVALLKNCEVSLEDALDQLSSRTHSEVVQKIGRRFVLFRQAKKPVIELPRA